MKNFFKTLTLLSFLTLPLKAENTVVIINNNGDMKWIDEHGDSTHQINALFQGKNIIDMIVVKEGFFVTYEDTFEKANKIAFLSQDKLTPIPYTHREEDNHLGGLAIADKTLYVGAKGHIKRFSISFGAKGLIQQELNPIFLQNHSAPVDLLPHRLTISGTQYFIVDHDYNFHIFDLNQRSLTSRPQIESIENDFMGLWVGPRMVSLVDAQNTSLFQSTGFDNYVRDRFAPKVGLKQDIRFHHMDVADRPNIQFDFIDGVNISAVAAGPYDLLWVASRLGEKTWIRAYDLYASNQHGPKLKINDHVIAMCPLNSRTFMVAAKASEL